MTDFLAWADEIESMAADARLTREYQAELDWYRTYIRFDIEQVLATAEGRTGFHAGGCMPAVSETAGRRRP